MVVGHPTEDDESTPIGFNAGAVTVYERVNGEWTKEKTFFGTEPESRFGSAVALDGDRFVTNAPGPGSWNGTATVCPHATGALYVYEKTADNWEQTAVLQPPGIEPNNDCLGGRDRASYGLALDGDLLAAGASGHEGKAFVYRHDGSGWALEETLSKPGDVSFGKVDVTDDPDRLAIGSVQVGNDGLVNWSAETNGTWVSVHVYSHTETGWIKTATLNSTHRMAGFRVTLNSDGSTVAAVGSPWSTSVPVQVWEETGDRWSPPTDLWPQDDLGHLALVSDLSVQDGTLAVGAWLDDVTPALVPEHEPAPAAARCGTAGLDVEHLANPCADGAVYIFRRTDASWDRTAKITQTTDTGVDAFGWDVSLDQETLIVGAPEDDGPVVENGQVDTATWGAVYTYEDTDAAGKALGLVGRASP